MHTWGDDWPYWNDLNEAVEFIAKEFEASDLSVLQIKEKYGTLRAYISCPTEGKQAEAYRSIYEATVKKWPHIAPEILSDADWFKEFLVGIVDPTTCKHKSTWKCGEKHWCGTCGKDMKES